MEVPKTQLKTHLELTPMEIEYLRNIDAIAIAEAAILAPRNVKLQRIMGDAALAHELYNLEEAFNDIKLFPLDESDPAA